MSGNEGHALSVSRDVSVPAEQLFAVLVDPARHKEIDGSGMVRGAATAGPLRAVGDIFTMDMEQEAIGQYQSDNVVTELDRDRKIAWRQGRPGDRHSATCGSGSSVRTASRLASHRPAIGRESPTRESSRY